MQLGFAALAFWGASIYLAVRRAEMRTTGVEPPLSTALPALIAVAVAASQLHSASVAAGLTTIALCAAAPADVRTGLLFDAVTLPTAAIVLFLAIVGNGTTQAAAGVLVTLGSFGTIYLVSGGRWVGLGDVKALYAIGAAFGPLFSLLTILFASLSAVATAAVRRSACRDRQLPFAPHLAMGALIVLCGGPFIARSVLGLS